MSDGFDKEAEREKLREKLADDEEKREHTQRMSELLLQGATMTNRHCDDCGDPIFRKDGQEFCPTCHTVDAADAEAVESTAGQSPQSTSTAEQSPSEIEEGSPSATGGESPPAAAENGATGPRRTGREPAGSGPESAAETADPSVTGTREPSTATGPAQTESTPIAGASGEKPAAPASAGSESVDVARASLARTLNRFAAAAEETNDPRRARDHLRAAREAAEALAALDG